MPYYVREVPTIGYHVWKVTDPVAYRLGIPYPRHGLEYVEAAPGETAWETLKRMNPQWFEPGREQFTGTILGQGQYYPRIARPSADHPQDRPSLLPRGEEEKNFLAITRSQVTALMRQLETICQTVHPCGETFHTYGHSIRNLLVLACSEVEAQWRGIFVANNYIKKRYNTSDYILLKNAMRLGDYAVVFSSYPWLPPFRPFEGWETDEPTKSLKWYEAYNAVKHNREAEFNKGTLARMIDAVSACVVMIVAQFGELVGLGRGTELASFFSIVACPKWPLSEVYIRPYEPDSDEAGPRNFEFRL